MAGIIDPKAVKALGTINWLVVHSCGHPSQRFIVLERQPPCAECYKEPVWRGMKRHRVGEGFMGGLMALANMGTVEALTYARVSLTTTTNGYMDVTYLWWPVSTEEEAKLTGGVEG